MIYNPLTFDSVSSTKKAHMLWIAGSSRDTDPVKGPPFSPLEHWEGCY